jgi:fucokinase
MHMNIDPLTWDYLIVTASNQTQARFYETQLVLRSELGLLSGVEQILVVPDPQDQRIGSGGSTIYALLSVINREGKTWGLSQLSPSRIKKTLQRLRILIIHAGGDSRRMPAYGPCGKIFTPIPGKLESPLGNTIFDTQFPIYRKLPPSQPGQGQVVVTTGDVLLFFSPENVKFQGKGVTGLGCAISPEMAKNHGVFCADRKGEVQHFLQKPSLTRQKEKGAIDEKGKALLDIGIMELDPATAANLIQLVDIAEENNEFCWTGPMAKEITLAGLDFYRDICCAMGKKARLDEFVHNVRASGSHLSEPFLANIFDAMSNVPFSVHPLKECTFLHFGTPRQLIETGSHLQRMEQGPGIDGALLSMNNHIPQNGRIVGTKSWVEGCHIASELTLGGENVVVGVDVSKPLSLPEKTCLDVIKGHDRDGNNVWFIRLYGIDDSFKASIEKSVTFVNRPFAGWLDGMGISKKDIWDVNLDDDEKNLWNAKIFPAVSSPNNCHKWLWMTDPLRATADQIRTWQNADKYSLEEMAYLVDLDDFYERRRNNRTEDIRRSLTTIFQHDSLFSAEDLALIFESLDDKDRAYWITFILNEALRYIHKDKKISELERLIFSRAAHTLGSAVERSLAKDKKGWNKALHHVLENMPASDKRRLSRVGLDSSAFRNGKTWCTKVQESAFENMSRTIVRNIKRSGSYPRCAVRSDAIIWGRAPVRLDLGGGWTDTPPYALEHGGCVINAAVNLNGQPPIHVYARVVDESVIRITSIDHGMRVVIKDLEDLMDYRKATSEFGLAKAALALSGFSLDKATWPNGIKTLEGMLERFGGGIELTTLAAIPSGSGLGTSSIMGAVLLSVINRLIGRKTNQRELFNLVLQLEQELTTGGGWQDQIGGILGGVKIITTEPGLVPDPKIQAVNPDILDPVTNEGQILLYYTGMRRLAKNILRNIVGRYLDRNRSTMDTLRKLHVFPPLLVDTMERGDLRSFGELIDKALHLKKEIDPDATNPEMEKILEKFKPHMIGATFLGAGGGGFLLVVGKSPKEAEKAKKELEIDPPNALARFFDYDISTEGLEVTVC